MMKVEDLKKTEGYWTETLENALWRCGVKKYFSTAKGIMNSIKFDVNNPEHVLRMQALIDALDNFIGDAKYISE